MDDHRNKIKVECYAGYKYPEKPRFLWLEGRKIEVKEILSSWRTEDRKPGKRSILHFRLKTEENEIWEIGYDEGLGQWFLAICLSKLSFK
ncbi:MAG: hypothetical protein ONB05_10350 [candidate division KSB1 bacterium]|nr:hypothetical protein [candidate division KSB1 bacterium]